MNALIYLTAFLFIRGFSFLNLYVWIRCELGVKIITQFNIVLKAGQNHRSYSTKGVESISFT
jgi:hypothetical protein